jgi:hypothetical protein
MAAVAVGGSIAILLAAGILAFLNFVSEEQRRTIAGKFTARAKRTFRRRPKAHRTTPDRQVVRSIWTS